MTSVRRALVFSFVERYALIAISLLSNILLARLLTPEEIGIYSVSLAVIGIAQVLRDFGIGNFLIQEKHLSEAHIRTAFSFSLLIGGGLFIIFYFAAPWAGSFYDENRMVETLRISALNFLVLPFCTISLALLRRDMAFKRLALVNLLAASVGSAVTIGLAYSGFGANSMAMGAVAVNLLTGVGAWLARSAPKALLPGFSEWRVLLRFGSQNAVANLVTTISMDINDLVLGKILGFAPVAIISRAQGLMNLFHRDVMGAIRNVAYPAFARAYREGESLDSQHSFSVSAVTVVAWPFYGFTALFSLEILRLMFGPQWDEAADIVPIFCLAGAVAATSNLVLNIVLAAGRIDLVTKSELLFQPCRAAMIVGAAFIFKSLFACAMTYFFAFVIYTPLVYKIKGGCIPNNYRVLCSALWASAKVTLATLAFPIALWANAKVTFITISTPIEFPIQLALDRNTPAGIPVLFAAIALGALSWFIAVIIFKHPVKSDPLFRRFTSKLPVFA